MARGGMNLVGPCMVEQVSSAGSGSTGMDEMGGISLCVAFLVLTVDCWDGPDGEPVVHHGYTLTSKILFRDVAETINKYAFIKNE